MMSNGDSAMAEQVPVDWGKKIVHATPLTGADEPPEWYKKPQGLSVSLNVDLAAEAERIFNALAENGIVQIPLQETFWALRFGMVVDQFGIPWMVNCGREPVWILGTLREATNRNPDSCSAFAVNARIDVNYAGLASDVLCTASRQFAGESEGHFEFFTEGDAFTRFEVDSQRGNIDRFAF
jgi:PhnB protein